MAIVVVGGQARKVGKTSVVAGLISAISERRWTAIKTSGHIHQRAPGAASSLIVAGQGFRLTDESGVSGATDTARFAAAGAERVYWLQAEAGGIEEAVPHLRQLISPASDVIVESNGIVEWLAPDVYLLVLDFGVEDFKASARRFLPRASAFLVHGDREKPLWKGVSLDALPPRPMLCMRPPQYVTAEIIGFVRHRLAGER